MEELELRELRNVAAAVATISIGMLPSTILLTTVVISRRCNQVGINICDIAKPGSKPAEEACLDGDFLTIEDFRKECAGEIVKATLCDDKSCGVAVEWKCEE